MNIVCADLETVLRFRDERVSVQNELLKKYGVPVVSFTMNIAGPIKRNELTDYVFDDAVARIKSALGEPACCRIFKGAAGAAAIMAYRVPAQEIKRQCIAIENDGDVGRLLDIDVIEVSGEKLTRGEERRCLICGGSVTACARSRAHSLRKLQERTGEILSRYVAGIIADKAVTALTDEVSLTPKPGLVDRLDSGAHTDMDWNLMVKSAHSLHPYFRKAALLGLEGRDDLPARLQQAGLEAEKTMLEATGGVNTHKGAIYSLGLLCAAKAACLSGSSDDVCSRAAEIAGRLKAPDALTHGSAVRKTRPGAGPREEALAGFPSVRLGVSMLRSGADEKAVLLELISRLDDSNVLWRGGEDGLSFIRSEARRILASPRENTDSMLSQLNAQCISRNISPGGAADLLAAALLLQALDT